MSNIVFVGYLPVGVTLNWVPDNRDVSDLLKVVSGEISVRVFDLVL